MTSDRSSTLESAILLTYCLFAIALPFSTALTQISLGISTVLFAIVCVISRHNPFAGQLKPVYLAIGALVAWRIVSTLFSANPMGALGDMRSDWLFTALPVGVWLMQRETFRRYVLGALIAGVVLVGVYAYIQHTTGFDYRGNALTPAPDSGFRAIGTFHNELTFGNFCAVAAMTLFGAGVSAIRNSVARWRTALMGAALFAAMASGLSYSRGSLITMILGVVAGCWLLAKSRAWLPAVVAPLLVGAFIITHPGLTNRKMTEVVKEQAATRAMSRQYIWTHSLRVVGDNLLFGTGPGQFREAYVATLPENAVERTKHSHAHNDLLTVAVETGVIGTVFFLYLWMTVIRQTVKGIKLVLSPDSMLVMGALFGIGAFLITGLTEASFHDEELSRMLMIVWAFGLWPLGKALAASPELAGKSS